MPKKRYKKPSLHRKIALDRIKQLFSEAAVKFKYDKLLADRYVYMARKLSMKYKTKIPADLKKRYCKHCKAFLVPGGNCRVRVSNGKLVYLCLECQHFMRFPYKK